MHTHTGALLNCAPRDWSQAARGRPDCEFKPVTAVFHTSGIIPQTIPLTSADRMPWTIHGRYRSGILAPLSKPTSLGDLRLSGKPREGWLEDI